MTLPPTGYVPPSPTVVRYIESNNERIPREMEALLGMQPGSLMDKMNRICAVMASGTLADAEPLLKAFTADMQARKEKLGEQDRLKADRLAAEAFTNLDLAFALVPRASSPPPTETSYYYVSDSVAQRQEEAERAKRARERERERKKSRR